MKCDLVQVRLTTLRTYTLKRYVSGDIIYKFFGCQKFRPI